MKILRWIDQNEKFLFYALIAFNLSFIYRFGNFPTLDGPAHLNNSRIIFSMIFEHNEVLKNYFTFNPTIEPNWTGHIVISFLMLFFKANVCEKIFLTFYIVMLPISFRNLMNRISNGKVLLSYFIFPFSFSLIFFLGFYNFSFGLVMLFISLNYFIKNYSSIDKIQHLIIFTLMQLIAYFSHIVIFAALWLCIILWLLNYYWISKQTIKSWFLKEGERLYLIFMTGLIPLVLFIMYFSSHATFNQNAFYVDMKILIKWLYQVRVKVVFVTEDEENYTTWIFILLMALFVLAINNRILNFKQEHIKIEGVGIHNKWKRVFKVYDMWLLVAMVFLLLYFMLPDKTSTGSVISVRFSLLFYLFLIVWIANVRLSKEVQFIVISFVLFIHWSSTKYYTEILRPLNSTINEIKQTARYIAPNSTVIAFNFSNSWLRTHYANYLGIDKPMVVLMNYECSEGYFPLIWNTSETPDIYLGKQKQFYDENYYWKTNLESEKKVMADYVFVHFETHQPKDTNMVKVNLNLKEFYTLVCITENCSLYKNKKLPDYHETF
jgi:hypothetical protein